MADMIVVMNAGSIEKTGSPLKLYDRPANRFVAELIGPSSMNMIDGVVRRNGDAVVVEADGARLPAPDAAGMSDGRMATFGIRPEHLELGRKGLPPKVSVVEQTDAETHLAARFGERDLVAAFRERHPLRPSQELRLRPMRERAFVFDSETGERLA